MSAKHDHSTQIVEGEFQYPIYSPKGGVEGALLHAGNDPIQLVFEPHGGPGSDAFAGIEAGQIVSVEALAEGPSDKGEAAHAVYRFGQLMSIDGRKPAKREPAARAQFSGTVVRLNFARHGEANGVVLDSGHFIHTRPEGMAKLKLEVGDRVEADGESRPLVTGGGRVVEATSINGKKV